MLRSFSPLHSFLSKTRMRYVFTLFSAPHQNLYTILSFATSSSLNPMAQGFHFH